MTSLITQAGEGVYVADSRPSLTSRPDGGRRAYPGANTVEYVDSIGGLILCRAGKGSRAGARSYRPFRGSNSCDLTRIRGASSECDLQTKVSDRRRRARHAKPTRRDATLGAASRFRVTLG